MYGAKAMYHSTSLVPRPAPFLVTRKLYFELDNDYRSVRIKYPWAGNHRMQRKRGMGTKCIVRRK